VDDRQHWPCTTCGDETAFEQPPCADGHTADGGECPEWVCTGCGAGVLLGAPQPVVTAARRAA
jgi:ribosomal protein L37AE/L43A